jgi:hypothetical protein
MSIGCSVGVGVRVMLGVRLGSGVMVWVKVGWSVSVGITRETVVASTCGRAGCVGLLARAPAWQALRMKHASRENHR